MRFDRFCSWLAAALFLLLAGGTSSVAQRPVVWFDQGHGQKVRVDQDGPLQLSSLAELLVGEGLQVKTGRRALDDELLGQAQALVISGAFQPLQPGEIQALHRFVESGGRLLILLHIAPPLGPLLQSFGVDFSNGVIREQRQVLGQEPLNFSVTDLARHPLLTNVQSVAIYGAWALLGMDLTVQSLAQTSPEAWVDLNGNRILDRQDARQAFAVVVAGHKGRGEFLVFGDDALFQNRFIGGNRQLAQNLAHWLSGATSPLGTLAYAR